MSEAFRSLLSCLAADLKLPEIPEQGGMALLVVDDFEVVLRLLPSEQVLAYTVVAPLPFEGRAALMASLLDANTMFLATQGFTLSAREDTGVLLQGMMPLSSLHGANISQWVGNFVSVAEHWQTRCTGVTDSQVEHKPHAGEGAIDLHTMMDMLRV
ncbi:MAG: type III secretion system chaperone [Mailhella sp.]|nr:type III secretion system chaperone [Mailhella sp.]